MTTTTTLVPAQPIPALKVPPSSTTVDVRVIDTTSRIHLPAARFLSPAVRGHDDLDCVAFSFLITHPPTGKHYLFDLGVRKDFDGIPPAMYSRLKDMCTVDTEKNVDEILSDDTVLNIKPADITAVIWSHGHFDHTGDMSTFPSSVGLVVGDGLRDALLPGYPEDPNGQVYTSDFDRPVTDITFTPTLQIAGVPAFDFFGDGSFYLISLPGHAPGHMGGLARVTADPPSFVLMGGDTTHHGAEFRPSPYLPLPTSISPSPLPHRHASVCPGDLFLPCHRDHKADKPYYDAVLYADKALNDQSRDFLEVFDASDDVLVVIAHDSTLVDKMPLFPDSVNGWKKTNLKQETRWSFLADFDKAI